MNRENRTILVHLSRFIQRPIRRARDCYVRIMTNLAGRVNYCSVAAVMTYPICSTDVPKSYNYCGTQLCSVDEDLRDLIRFASRSGFGGEGRMGQRMMLGGRRKCGVAAVVPV